MSSSHTHQLRKTMKTAITAIALLAMSGLTSAQEGYSAKSLFFGDDGSVKTAATAAPPAAAPAPAPAIALKAKSDTKGKQKKTLVAKQIGASYFIRLKNDDGTTRDVLANTTFKSGDRFQLGVKVNRPSYVYVLNQDPDGNMTQIFPVAGQDNYVNAMGTVFLPARGAFEFDAKPGAEHLLVFLSPTPMKDGVRDMADRDQPDMVSSTGGACAAPVGHLASNQPAMDIGTNDVQFASKGIAFKDDPAQCAVAAPAFASKAIVFSDDARPEQGGQVASYVVKKLDNKADKNLFLKIKLAHE
jgi:hypothetical protein